MKDFFDKYINKENLKKAIDWFQKNRRFFIAALLFVALVVLLKACTGKETAGDSTEGADAEGQTEDSTGADGFALDTDFEQDAYEEVNSLIAAYFDAYASADIDALLAVASPVSDNEKSYINVFSQYIESYEDISCYTKSGPGENSYLVSAYFNLKFYDVATTAPGLDFFYVETTDDGTLLINNRYSSYNLSRTEYDLDPAIYAVILQFEQQEDSVALREQVETAYADAVASDVDLATMLSTTIPNAMTGWVNSIADAGEAEEDTEETGTEETGTEVTGIEETESAENGTETADASNSTDVADADAADNAGGADNADADESQADVSDESGADGTQDAAAGDDTVQETTKQVVKVKITSKTVNVRKEPNTSSSIIGKVKKGETYTELDDLDGWFAISYDGQTGYVSADYVTEVTEEVTE